MKQGDRVNHEYLGQGTFIKEIASLSLVKWDKTPPERYNMGENPCVVFTKELQTLEKEVTKK